MEGREAVPTPEVVTLRRNEQVRRLVLEAYRESAKTRMLPRVGNLRDDKGNTIERRAGRRDHVEMIPVPEQGKLVNVETGSGVIVDGQAELLTKEVTGCLAAFLFERSDNGFNRSGLIHLTATSSLAWGNFSQEEDNERWGHQYRAQTIDIIVDDLIKNGIKTENTTVILIGNRGSEPQDYYSGYSEPEQQKKREDLATLLRAKGLRVQIAEPMDGSVSTLYWTPEHPETITTFTGGQNEKEASVATINIAENGS